MAWLGERSGAEKPARKRLGGKGYKPLDPAPGTYVLEPWHAWRCTTSATARASRCC